MAVTVTVGARDERRGGGRGPGVRLLLGTVLAQEVGDGGVTDELDSWTPRTSDSEDP